MKRKPSLRLNLPEGWTCHFELKQEDIDELDDVIEYEEYLLVPRDDAQINSITIAKFINGETVCFEDDISDGQCKIGQLDADYIECPELDELQFIFSASDGDCVKIDISLKERKKESLDEAILLISRVLSF